jgi:hypothetical protein
MNSNIIDLLYDYFFAVISITGAMIGIDSIPENQTIIQVITSPSAESGVDVTQKVMTILSLLISSISGLIPIIKTFKRNK